MSKESVASGHNNAGSAENAVIAGNDKLWRDVIVLVVVLVLDWAVRANRTELI